MVVKHVCMKCLYIYPQSNFIIAYVSLEVFERRTERYDLPGLLFLHKHEIQYKQQPCYYGYL